MNIKQYKTAADADEFISYKLKPQLKTLGPKTAGSWAQSVNFWPNAMRKRLWKRCRAAASTRWIPTRR
ncbi:MAG: hypothetical protein ACLS4Z_07210 [Christensenellaceae bacterium]